MIIAGSDGADLDMYAPLMDLFETVAVSWIAVVLVWVIGTCISLALTWWIIRSAILSALAEDRRRVADERRFLRDLDAQAGADGL